MLRFALAALALSVVPAFAGTVKSKDLTKTEMVAQVIYAETACSIEWPTAFRQTFFEMALEENNGDQARAKRRTLLLMEDLVILLEDKSERSDFCRRWMFIRESLGD